MSFFIVNALFTVSIQTFVIDFEDFHFKNFTFAHCALQADSLC